MILVSLFDVSLLPRSFRKASEQGQRPLLTVAIANDGWLRGWNVCFLCSVNAASSPRCADC